MNRLCYSPVCTTTQQEHMQQRDAVYECAKACLGISRVTNFLFETRSFPGSPSKAEATQQKMCTALLLSSLPLRGGERRGRLLEAQAVGVPRGVPTSTSSDGVEWSVIHAPGAKGSSKRRPLVHRITTANLNQLLIGE